MPSKKKFSVVFAMLVASSLANVAMAQLRQKPTLVLGRVDESNTFVGSYSGNANLEPLTANNTALGANALAWNARGNANTALGADALYSNSIGYHNTAVGYVALAGNDHGHDNVAVGHSAMYKNQSGAWNVAIGLQALYSNTTGNNNVAIGRDANFSNTSGNWNTGVGVDALPGVETGSGNTAIGGEAGYTEDPNNQNVSGSNNTWIGYQSGPSSPMQHDGVIGIGYRAKTSKDNQAVLGSPQIVETLLFGKVGINADDPSAALVVNGDALNLTGVWGVYSDARLKSNVVPFEDGLDLVMQLEPVRFNYNGLEGLAATDIQVGLIAQDVERVAPYMVSRHEGRQLEDLRVLTPQALPYMLVNAIQELEAKVADLERRLAAAEAKNAL